ncbi:hypothetical protein ACFSTE_00440 [Aquimarina hainanensis]|uniref:Uncharacterized protein n=1 Tax=Aquimarina hainanensis TaxID=1578017 RepID=A0ABW5N3C1_9FLAO
MKYYKKRTRVLKNHKRYDDEITIKLFPAQGREVSPEETRKFIKRDKYYRSI